MNLQKATIAAGYNCHERAVKRDFQSFREFLNTCLAFNFADQILNERSSEHFACKQIVTVIATWFLRIQQTAACVEYGAAAA